MGISEGEILKKVVFFYGGGIIVDMKKSDKRRIRYG